MESTTYIKNVFCSPKKIRFAVAEIRRMSPAHALEHLYYTTKKPSRLLHTAVKSAVTNATAALKTDSNLLQFKAIIIEEGRVLKRYRPGGRGGVNPRKKRYSHIKIVLGTKDVVTTKSEEIAIDEETKKEAKQIVADVNKAVKEEKKDKKEKRAVEKKPAVKKVSKK